MHTSSLLAILGSAVTFTTANPLQRRDSPIQGVATFNDYATQFKQSGTVCGIAAPANPSYFGAAASDISGITAGACDGTFEGPQENANYDQSKCDPNNPGIPISTYLGPSCPKTQCPDTSPTCYKVDNMGDIASSPLSTPTGNSITVQIIDACPAGSAWNYCKPASIDARTRCGSYGTNELDIDEGAYAQLAGRAYQKDVTPNLNIQITKVAC
ncbi:MAG: hypothetical protein HETSPECPRED_009480 [Heterodermia speciosa]|uniref:Expansin-like EG45 domain-containing protein n=1 Tax=Heterodermia speciosa TaxID=116794 RepID=A0A8H3ESH5_9LECA|nr:MAG: hypothetical protein HETSPECPRED_009480 [Heterodermia speciosa]